MCAAPPKHRTGSGYPGAPPRRRSGAPEHQGAGRHSGPRHRRSGTGKGGPPSCNRLPTARFASARRSPSADMRQPCLRRPPRRNGEGARRWRPCSGTVSCPRAHHTLRVDVLPARCLSFYSGPIVNPPARPPLSHGARSKGLRRYFLNILLLSHARSKHWSHCSKAVLIGYRYDPVPWLSS